MTTWFPESQPVRPQFYFPPAPPPLSAATSNPNPRPWTYQPRKASVSGSGSGSGSSPHVQVSRNLEPVAHHQAMHSQIPHARVRKDSAGPQFDLVDGVDYFKIGEFVRIRRWTAATDSFSDWITGRIVRPVLVENDDGSQRRTYLVEYEHPRNKKPQQKEFSPHLLEITSLASGPPTAVHPLAMRNNNNIVFAPIPASDASGRAKGVVYTPALVLTSPNEQGGVRLRILAGPAAKREVSNFAVKHSVPYNAESVQMLRQKGFRIEGNGVDQSTF
ncbi:hypothetical protein C8R43DRAFT_1123931 [Mycena crocata]|nr:hypothetical protein C8R43DRAFT_1123931 [Mycena crocata]